MEMVGVWSNALVFSSQLTKLDILENSPEIKSCEMRVLPQGKCKKITKEKNVGEINKRDEEGVHTWKI